jgi:hypothetical protein
MSKKAISVTIDSEVLEKVKEFLGGDSLSAYISNLMDENLGLSKQRKEQELKDVKDRVELEEKNRIASDEYDRIRHSKMTPEELEQEKKDQERSDRMAALSYSGVHVSDEEWRSGVLNKDKVIETRPDTSEFADPEYL